MRRHPHILFALVAVSLVVAQLPAPQAEARRPRNVLRFTAQPGATLLVHGTYPPVRSSCVGPTEQPVLHERYRGSVEVHRSSDGSMFLIGELPFEDYLKGIAEVPRSWPMEALKAQVVAARTYALSQLDPSGLYDLCATDACQVYVGAGIELGAWGRRWATAVDQTAGQALLHEGEPAVTFYSSTSPGRTFDNEDVFGGEPLPYLRGIVEEDDGASPLAHWEVRLPFTDLSRFLAADGRWSGKTIRRVTVEDGRISVKGRKTRVSLGKGDLRDAVNDTASCLMPAEYPSTEPDGARLPQAVPSIWYRATTDGTTLVLTGRGWGHGVGMVQWGAYGKARRGLAFDEILAAYYGGLRPQAADVPETIRVLLAEDLTSVTIAPSGDADIDSTARSPDPPWKVTGGRRLHLHHGPPPAAQLDLGGFDVDRRGRSGRPVSASLHLGQAARVRLEVLDGSDLVGTTTWRSFHEGPVSSRFGLPRIARGRYRVRAVVTDGVDTVATGTRRVRVAGPAAPSPSPSPSATPLPSPPASVRAAPADRSTSPGPALVAAAAALAAATLLILLLRRSRGKGLHRGP